ncbi:MAG: ABC transporter ATP-binding protein [Nitrospirae bacterium]|nr:ABC transporter ATP-binding protein [Nitrospirota bacterium]
MIILDGIGKSFNGKWAVRGLSLTIERGEIFGILGPNGAGKTTAIRMMTGQIMPTEGRILIGGHDIVKEPLMAKSIIGYVPDRAFFYEKLTARELLLFIASLYGVEKQIAHSRMNELVEQFGIKDYIDELIEGYSQGMRQRLLFVSAMLHNPSVFVIDEPVVGLDPMGVILVKNLIKDMSARGITVFLATHILHIAGELCHRVGLLNKGLLTEVKHRDEFLSRDAGLEALFLERIKP